MMYNYYTEMEHDIVEHIRENYTAEEISANLEDREAWEEDLYDSLWIRDSVTGNASGSYWFNSYKAEEALLHNWDLLASALANFGCDDINPIEKGAEWCDVTIRCYILGCCISNALDTVEEEMVVT